ncbi:MAG: hypothetical protein ACJ0DJ_13340 [bacterium]
MYLLENDLRQRNQGNQMPTADQKPLLLPNTKVSMPKQGSALKEDYQLKFQILSQKVEI